MQSIFETVSEEHTSPVDGRLKGTIPAWINGSLYRNGPGMFEVGDTKFSHWFDGLALLHRFHISNGKATYQSRFLGSDTYKKCIAANRIVVTQFGTAAYPDPCKNIFQRFFSWFQKAEKTDNTVVSFYPVGDQLFTATETNFLHRIDPTTLDTMEQVNLCDFVAVYSATAHAHREPSGTVHNIGYSNKGYAFIKVPPPKDGEKAFVRTELVATVAPQWKLNPGYFHSFGMTENYYIFLEQPLTINLLKLMFIKVTGSVSLKDSFTWWTGYRTRFRIVDRRTGQLAKTSTYEAEPFFCFHHINAYEDEGHLVIDLCCYEDNGVIDVLDMEQLSGESVQDYLRKVPRGQARRYVLPLHVNTETTVKENLVTISGTSCTAVRDGSDSILCTFEKLTNIGFEFPVLNYTRCNTKKYKYCWGIGLYGGEEKYRNTIVKVEVETKSHMEWAEEGAFPSEAIFVPRPDSTEEDDGVLLSAVTNVSGGKTISYLLVLDASTMTELARVEFDVKLPKDLHGHFMDGV